jgi:hypothetical protein
MTGGEQGMDIRVDDKGSGSEEGCCTLLTFSFEDAVRIEAISTGIDQIKWLLGFVSDLPEGLRVPPFSMRACAI